MKTNDFFNSINAEINSHHIEDVAEKVGFLLFGEVGRAIGKVVGDATKDKKSKPAPKKISEEMGTVMIHMYRFTIGDAEYGGCVLASSEEEAREKLKLYYTDKCGENPTLTILIDDEISPDIVQVYP